MSGAVVCGSGEQGLGVASIESEGHGSGLKGSPRPRTLLGTPENSANGVLDLVCL